MFDDSPVLLLMMALLAAVSLGDVARHRAALFDARLSADERTRLVRFAAFVLLPLSVLAHEGGHAVAVRLFGGEVVDFGFYLYYGYVSHIGSYTALELAVIAFAGTLVNVVTALAALAVAWYRTPRPDRVAGNYLLFVFGALSLFNSLIFYPLLDALGGVAGDWQQIYSRETPVFSILIALNHIALLAAAALIWRSPRFQAGYALRTGRRVTPAAAAGQPAGGEQPSAAQRELTGLLTVAAAIASDGWRHPVELTADHQAGGSQVVLRWESGGFRRALLVHGRPADGADGRVELHAAVEPQQPSLPPYQRALARIDGQPTSQELVPYVRRFLDYVDAWDGANVISAN